MTTKLFGYILIAYVAFALFGSVFDYIFPSAIPEALSLAKDTNESSISLIFLVIVGLILLVGGIATTIGLYLFRPWAPHLAVVITVLTLLISPFLDADVVSGWSMAFTSLSDTLWGAILTLAYFSPLNERFLANRYRRSRGTPQKRGVP